MKRNRTACLLVLAFFAVASCVYDFHPQIDGDGGYLIVEGNIVVGERFQITTGWSWSLVDTTQGDERWQILASNRMHIEASDGTRYEDIAGTFDLREADPSLQYRLVIENNRGTYQSSWASPLPPGQIDSLSYRISDDRTTMSILVAAHADDALESYYRWTVEETWEYHADVRAFYKYVETGGVGDVVPMDESESRYYCWNTARRPEIMTGSTQGLVENRLADHQIYTITNRDQRLSMLYRADVRQMRIPEDAYRYWQVMERNSSDIGGLFSPEPSELRGNIVCVERPEELVLGYVGVVTVATHRLQIRSYEVRFYRSPGTALPLPDTLATAVEWQKAFRSGKAPSDAVWDEVTGRMLGYEWWPNRCVDCLTKGGTKNRPHDWPNNDY